MNLNDPIGDLLTRIRNGQRANIAVVGSPSSKMRLRVLDVLQREGYIRGYTISSEGAKAEVKVELKYYEGQPVIKKIDRISKPGRRVYTKIKDLQKYYNGLGISIISTPQGVMSDKEARAANLGGELLCRVF
jgi:small subunit ribosomal protein S8